jgi:3-hydroxybutyryl-CoA dehydrogenase
MKVSEFGVVGAGSMGCGIAQVAATAGYKTQMFDVGQPQLERAMGIIQKSLAKLEEKGKITEKAAVILARIHPTSELRDLSKCDFVVEAASENREVKFKLFRDLDEMLPDHALITTNTSSISVTQIAAQTGRPEQIVGMHFMNPVPLMTLVEGIRGMATSDETFKNVRTVAESMGKVFIEAKDAPGFAVNRVLMPMINEAFFALNENLATPKDLDTAMKLGCGFPMGPLELADFVGLDVCLAVMEVLHRDLGDSKYRPAPLMRKYVEAGWFGRKVGRGVYVY